MTAEKDPSVYFTAPLDGPDSISDETLLERVEDETLLATFEIGGATISLHKGERPSEPAPAEKSPEFPDWMRWLAYDHDGSLWGYAEKPVAEEPVRRWVFTGQPPIKLAPATAPGRYRADWKNTLIEVHHGYHVTAKEDASAEAETTDHNLTRLGLEQDLKAAASDLLDHMGAAVVTLPLGDGREVRAGKTGDGDLHLSIDRGNEVRQLREQVESLTKELEDERMRHAACGVVAMSNTRKTLEHVMSTMDAAYKSASVSEVARAVGREIEYRERADDLAGQLATLQGQHATQAETIRAQDTELVELRYRLSNQRDAIKRYQDAHFGGSTSVVTSLTEQLRQRTAERDAANAKLGAIGDVGCLREQADAWHKVFKLLGEVDPGMGRRAARGIDEALASIRHLAREASGDRSYREQFDKFAEALQRAGTAAGLLPGDDLTLALVPKIKHLADDAASLRIQLEDRDKLIMDTRKLLGLVAGDSLAAAVRSKMDEIIKLKADLVDAHDARRGAEAQADRRNRRIGGEADELAGMPASADAGGESGRCILHIIELMPTKL